MKIIICFICTVIATSALAAHPHTKYSGVTYEVEIVRDNNSVTKGCMTFHENGRLTMPEESLTMLWASQVNFSSKFMAVTAPGERAIVPYHQGVYGEVLSDNTLKGRGIDQSGSTFEFHGKANDDCNASLSDRMERNANQLDTEQTRLPVASLPILDPCWTPPGYHVPCDPISDPLRAVNPSPSEPIRFLDPCQMADGSWTPCDPIPNPLRALDPVLDVPIHLFDPGQMADGSPTPCESIPNPRRALDPVLDDPIHLFDPGQLADGSPTPCDPVRAAVNPSPSEPIRFLDPCQLADGSWTPCDPIPDPLRGNNVQNVTPPTLAGRSFRLTLGTSDRSVLEYCWTFAQTHQIETANMGFKGFLTWSPDNHPHYDANFISAGAGANGQGMAYHGTLIGDNLLQLVGIEARDGNSLVTYGFGQKVASCK